MASITKNHAVLTVVGSNGTTNIVYPQNKGEDVLLDTTNTALPDTATNVQTLVDGLGSLAFRSDVSADDLSIESFGDYLYANDEEDETVEFTTSITADTLGGHKASYFAVAYDVTALTSTVTDISNTVTALGTAANKNFTAVVTNGSADVVTSGGVYTAISALDIPSTLVFKNVSVTTSSFVSNSASTDYPYKASITLSGVTADYVPSVNFSLTDATSGNFAPTADSAAGTVTIYAKEVPSATTTIPSITCVKGE